MKRVQPDTVLSIPSDPAPPVLLGPNGSGKSTLLRTLAGAQPPLAGSVHVGGEAIPRLTRRELARRIALVLSTHDLELALRTADRIWLLSGDGSLVDGGPEDLVLSRDIGRAFAQHGVRFDLDAGHFDWEVPVLGRAVVVGEGREAHWTRRALRRSGFEVSVGGDEAEVRVRVDGGGGSPSWTLNGTGGERRFSSIRELLRAVPEGS